MAHKSALHAEGVYFGLSDVEYHADPALGSTDIRCLMRSPADYWWQSAMNPLCPEDNDTPARLWGRAFHKLVLEGRDAFERAYAGEPNKSDYPEALVTVEDLKGALHEAGVTVKAAKKGDLADAVRKNCAGAVIWDDVLAAFGRDVAAGGKTPLPAATYAELVMSGAQIAKNDALREAFRNGRPEVSVFWENEGVRLKARFDYLRLKQVVDLKSFRNSNGAPVEKAVASAIATHRYDVQAAHYLTGHGWVGEFVGQQRVFGSGIPSKKWLSHLSVEPEYWLVFYQAEGAPITLMRRFRMGSPVIDFANLEVARAIQAYRDNLAEFGASQWLYRDPLAAEPDVDFDQLPKWMGA